MKQKILFKIIIGIICIAVCFGVVYSFIKKGSMEYKTDFYSVSVPKSLELDEPYEGMKQFWKEDEIAVYFEIYENCDYAESAESIAVNAFGQHGKLSKLEEKEMGNWTQYRMTVDYEVSAAEDIEGKEKTEPEIHYIYTNKKDAFIDIYVNDKLLSEDEIQGILDTFKIR